MLIILLSGPHGSSTEGVYGGEAQTKLGLFAFKLGANFLVENSSELNNSVFCNMKRLRKREREWERERKRKKERERERNRYIQMERDRVRII